MITFTITSVQSTPSVNISLQTGYGFRQEAVVLDSEAEHSELSIGNLTSVDWQLGYCGYVR